MKSNNFNLSVNALYALREKVRALTDTSKVVSSVGPPDHFDKFVCIMNNSNTLLIFIDAMQVESSTPKVYDTLKDFVLGLRDGEPESKAYDLPRRIRRELHTVCQFLGFRHVSKTLHKKRMMHISVNEDYEVPQHVNIERFREKEHALREKEHALREIHELQEKKRTRCDYCFRNGTECDVGMMVRFPHLVVCELCYEQDDELCPFKWESIFD